MRYTLLFTLFLLASCQPTKEFSSNKTLGEALHQLGIETAFLGEVVLEKAFQSQSEERQSYRVLTTHEENSINVDIDQGLDQVSFLKYKAMIEEQFFGNFHSRFAPYPGEITKRVICSLDFYPTAFQIVLQGGITATFFRTYVNSRHSWGVCEKEEIAGVRYWGLIYVPHKKLLMNLKFTYPKGKENSEQFFKFVKSLRFK